MLPEQSSPVALSFSEIENTLQLSVIEGVPKTALEEQLRLLEDGIKVKTGASSSEKLIV